LEPEWEAKFEPNSYGFRPGRSCHDAIGAIFIDIKQKAKYVLDADIKKCYDRINHEALLEKLGTFPTLRRTIRNWLKAGVMEDEELFPTEEGVPQGGVISPLLANVALHGMETYLKERFSKIGKNGWVRPGFIRYADDLVILHPDRTVIEEAEQAVAEWLAGMSLELKPEKTRIVHTLIGEHPGFDFLGFTVRQFPVGKYHTGTDSKGNPLGFKTIIKPSRANCKEHQRKLGDVIRESRAAPQVKLIAKLNPIIRGWSNYYSSVVSAAEFSRQDSLVFLKLRR
jgi:RNA-directed DNA polymerase